MILINLFALITLVLNATGLTTADISHDTHPLSRLVLDKLNQAPQNSTAQDSNIVSRASEAVGLVNVYKDITYQPQERNYKRKPYSQRIDWLDLDEIFSTKQKVASGTAFFFTPDGYMLTNKHVVFDSDAEYTVSISDELVLPARVVYRDPTHDIAIIKVEGQNFPTIKLGNSSNLKIGEEVVGIGNALGKLTDSVTVGTVSKLNRNIMVTGPEITEKLRGLIQTNAQLYPGDSGGPLLDENGEAVGINVASAIGEEISFSIPINYAKSSMDKAGLAVN